MTRGSSHPKHEKCNTPYEHPHPLWGSLGRLIGPSLGRTVFFIVSLNVWFGPFSWETPNTE